LDEGSARRAEEFTGLPAIDVRSTLLAYTLAQPANRLVAGHFLLTKSIISANAENWQFITTLRNPIDRWLSHYNFNRERPGQKYYIDEPIEEFMESERGQRLGTIMVEYFSGGALSAGDSIDEAFGKALENLRQFTIVGSVEALPVFQSRLESLLGVSIKIGHSNRGPRKSFNDQDIRDKLKRICKPDLELYDRFCRQ